MPNPLIHASLVYDGTHMAYTPEQMGTPNENQLQGNAAENLCELALRVCYDSLGAAKSRSSAAAHAHIQEVKHLSVYEHFNFTVEISRAIAGSSDGLFQVLCNRPGVWVDHRHDDRLRMTLNLRSVLEWDSWSDEFVPSRNGTLARTIGECARNVAARLCPLIVSPAHNQFSGDWSNYGWCEAVEPLGDHERWISLYLTGSRGLSHELVRHGDFTAISQRSTRYVDEDGSPWVVHPLLGCIPYEVANRIPGMQCIEAAQQAYGAAVRNLEAWLVSKGVDKFTARKQARGAARGYLGNALHTELIFSANISQWKRMLRARCNPAADAEIRELFAKALLVLKDSFYSDSFDGMYLMPSPDGIGEVLTEAEDPVEA